ncbi:MAG: transposase [Betaproteobacteria bacterium]|nr:transposase [Betaproteobacteria bacterium]
MRPIRTMADTALKEFSPVFRARYAKAGRPSLSPEQLLRSLLLQIFYTIRSERMLVEQLDYNLLFRWFAGLSMYEPIWNHSVYSKNRITFSTATLPCFFCDPSFPWRETMQCHPCLDQ